MSTTTISTTSSPSSSPSSPTCASSSFTMPLSITPPGSPPSPTMSVDSIHGHALRVDSALSLDQRKIKVMIVDDNSINLNILSRMLEKHFTDIVQLTVIMTSGVEALQRLATEEFDLILMDIDMPVLTGVQTTVAIRQNTHEYPILEQNQNVPIIAVTTSDGAEQRELYQQVGMSDCVSKPINLANLRSAVEGAVKTNSNYFIST
ncbi:sensitivity to red-light reduced protein [Mortierella sp. GBA35]|nr:sensitivity to red-light reduced protein [Mortierella sp. GBA35]